MKYRDLVKNIGVYCIPSIASAILGIVIMPIISRVFPTEDYGKISFFYTVGNMLQVFCLFGLDSAYIRFYVEYKKLNLKDKAFNLCWIVSIFFSLLFYILVSFFYSKKVSVLLFGEENGYLLFLLLIYIISLMLIRLLSIDSRMDDRFALYNFQQILLILINKVAYIFAVFITTNYKFSVLIITIGTFIEAVCFLLYQKTIANLSDIKFSKNFLIKNFLFALPIMPNALLLWLNNSFAKFILSYHNDFSGIGILSIGINLANTFSIIPSAFCVYWAPFMYKNHNIENLLIKKVHNYILMLSIALVIGFFCFQDFIYLFIGKDYWDSKQFFLLLMIVPIQLLLCETTSYGINLSNKTFILLIISLLAFLINVITGFCLYNKYGITGVSFGVFVSAFFQLICKTVLGQIYYKSIENYCKTFIGYFLIVLVAICNTYIYKYYLLRIGVSFCLLVITIIVFRGDILSFKKYFMDLIKKND